MIASGFDLHIHTVHSDGLYSPLQILELARRAGLRGIAITDHDSLPCPAAMSQAMEHCKQVAWLTGVELSCEFGQRGIHLLGYAFDPQHAGMLQLVSELQIGRKERFTRLAEALGPRTNAAMRRKLDSMSQLRAPGRRHLARSLVELRLAGNLRSAFDRYLHPLAEFSRFDRPTVAAAVAAIHDAGGVAAIAHPPGNWDDDTWRSLKDAGVDGLELRFPSGTGNRKRRLEQVAHDFSFLTTGGSDFHGDSPADYVGRCTIEQLPFCNNL